MRSLLLPVLALLIVSATAQAQIAPREGWVVLNSPHGFETLVERVQAAVKANQMGLVTQASASVGAKAQGFEIPGNRVIGVYRNDFARRMLDASVAAGIEAPIRLYVTEAADGSTQLSYKTPSHVFAPYAPEGGDALATLAAELDGIFAAIAAEAVSP